MHIDASEAGEYTDAPARARSPSTPQRRPNRDISIAHRTRPEEEKECFNALKNFFDDCKVDDWKNEDWKNDF